MSKLLSQILKAVLLVLLLGTSASALQVVIMDRDLQTTLGTGESAGGRLSLQLAGDASGPVVVFIKDDNGQSSSFPGEVRGGQVVLESGSLAALLQARGVTLAAPAQRLGTPLNAPLPTGGSSGNGNDNGNGKGKGNPNGRKK